MKFRGWRSRRNQNSGGPRLLDRLRDTKGLALRDVRPIERLTSGATGIEVGTAEREDVGTIGLVAARRDSIDLLGWARVVALRGGDRPLAEVWIAAPRIGAETARLAERAVERGPRLRLISMPALADPAKEDFELQTIGVSELSTRLGGTALTIADRVLRVAEGATSVVGNAGVRRTADGFAVYVRGELVARVEPRRASATVSFLFPDERSQQIDDGNFATQGVELHRTIVELAQNEKLGERTGVRRDGAVERVASDAGVRITARWMPCTADGSDPIDFVGIDTDGRPVLGVIRDAIETTDVPAILAAVYRLEAERGDWAPGSVGPPGLVLSADRVDAAADEILTAVAASLRATEVPMSAEIASDDSQARRSRRSRRRRGGRGRGPDEESTSADTDERDAESRDADLGRREGGRRESSREALRRDDGGRDDRGRDDRARDERGRDERGREDVGRDEGDREEGDERGRAAAPPRRRARRGRGRGRGRGAADSDELSDERPDEDREEDSEIAARALEAEGEGAEAGAETDDAVEIARGGTPDETIEEPEESGEAPEEAEPPRKRRARAAIIAHADPESVMAALILARDRRNIVTFRTVAQEGLMDFFRGPANDIAENVDVLMVGFTAQPQSHDILTSAELFRGRLQWFDHHPWPVEDLERLRNAIGRDSILIESEAATSLAAVTQVTERRSRFTDKLVELSASRLSQTDMEKWGNRVAGLIRRISEQVGEHRSEINAVLSGKPAELPAADEIFRGEADWVEANDPRIVHFGEYQMAVVRVPDHLDPGEIARRVRLLTGARLSLSGRESDPLMALGCNEEKRPINVSGLIEQVGQNVPWASSRPGGDRIGRIEIEDLSEHPERFEHVIGEIVRQRSVLYG